jgi:acetoin utilization deacetylase AcuC-like enzyme
MGFCLFNSIAVGAQYAVSELGLSRVLIVDWDVHHGNGSQDIFWRRSDVAFMSIHRYPFYPGTGSSEETGAGAGLGWTLNLPIEYGTSRAAYLDAFRNGIERFASQAKPELILISAGFDAYWQDPIGSLGLQPEDFAEMTAIVLEISRAYCPGKVVSVLEGGYHLVGLADCVAAHLATWAMRE